MNKRIGIIAALVCAFVLCFALVGCGGADKTKFVGSWTLESGSDENLNADVVAKMKSLGYKVTLNGRPHQAPKAKPRCREPTKPSLQLMVRSW